MASTTSDRSSTDPSRTAADRNPRIDLSVFAAMAGVAPTIGVARFSRWFACFATAGREE